jgi:hypothetical protein
VADKMPVDISGQLRRLVEQLLHVVLSEHTMPAVVSALQEKRLGACNERRIICAVSSDSVMIRSGAHTCTSAAGLSLETATNRTLRPAAAAALSTRATADCGRGRQKLGGSAASAMGRANAP